MLARTKRDIAQRKAKLAQQSKLPRDSAQDPAAKLAALRASVAARLAQARTSGSLGRATPVAVAAAAARAENAVRPSALLLDDSGRVVDAAGNEVKLQRLPDFRANAKAKEAAGRTGVRQEAKVGRHRGRPHLPRLRCPHTWLQAQAQAKAEQETDDVLDPRLRMPETQRKTRGLMFRERGHFVAKANKVRAEEQLAKLQVQIEASAQKTGISSLAKLALMAPFKNDTEDLVVPDVEWWDALVMADGVKYPSAPEGAEQAPLLRGVTSLIEHPIEIQPPGAASAPVALPVMLTKKERKKLRTQRRKAEQEELTEKIRLGLAEAPAPKVKRNNFMRVLGEEAIADPTMVEKLVREQERMRQSKHENANAARALTKEEKAAKAKRKFAEKTTNNTQVSVYRLASLKNGGQRFKVVQNARQLQLTGMAVMTEGLAVVVVEGGPKGMRRFERLMLHRINWGGTKGDDEDEDEDDAAEAGVGRNRCAMVWKGIALKRAFSSFDSKYFKTEVDARTALNDHGVPQYWDFAVGANIIEATAADN